jgi:hypothetical protein
MPAAINAAANLPAKIYDDIGIGKETPMSK